MRFSLKVFALAFFKKQAGLGWNSEENAAITW
jgi:hypothetical protein